MIPLVCLLYAVICVGLLLAALVIAYPNYVPTIISHIFLFGKLRGLKGYNTCGTLFLVPKSWFTHFYVVGVVSMTLGLALTLYSCHLVGTWSEQTQNIVAWLRYPADLQSYGDMHSTVIVLTLSLIQVSRRLMECLLISVYSEGKMSTLIYLLGLLFYTTIPITCIAGSQLTACTDPGYSVRLTHVLGVLLFLWASMNQHQVAVQFAKLRKNKSGAVENTKHHIPHGTLFHYVSCPHYFTEILIYLAFNIVYGFTNIMLLFPFAFVVVNQMVAAHYVHKWYLETFPKYPKQRKAVIPFIF